MRDLISDIKRTIVFLGKFDDQNKSTFVATGFLVQIHDVFHLVTAKHVVMDPKTGMLIDENMCAFFNSKDNKIKVRSISDTKKKHGVEWIFHEKQDIDIALIPFKINIQTDDVKTVPDEMFITADLLSELYDVFFLSYQPGITGQTTISPVIRSGTISLINNDSTFYIDASAFPGNSGSPVFLKPSPIKFDKQGISIGSDKVGGKFAGVIGEYIPYQEIAFSNQTGRPRVIFEENTGLSKVWSATFLKEIMESNNFKLQLEKLLQSN